MTAPLAKPNIPQINNVMKTTNKIGRSGRLGNNFVLKVDFCSNVAAIQDPKPTRRPADKSVPFVIKAPLTPKAMINRTAVLTDKFLKFPKEKKFDSLIPTYNASITRIMMIALFCANRSIDFLFIATFSISMILLRQI